MRKPAWMNPSLPLLWAHTDLNGQPACSRSLPLIAAFSCANSGFYGTVRALYGLSVEGMAPKFLSNLNRFSVPQNATLFTIIPGMVCVPAWILL